MEVGKGTNMIKTRFLWIEENATFNPLDIKGLACPLDPGLDLVGERCTCSLSELIKDDKKSQIHWPRT